MRLPAQCSLPASSQAQGRGWVGTLAFWEARASQGICLQWPQLGREAPSSRLSGRKGALLTCPGPCPSPARMSVCCLQPVCWHRLDHPRARGLWGGGGQPSGSAPCLGEGLAEGVVPHSHPQPCLCLGRQSPCLSCAGPGGLHGAVRGAGRLSPAWGAGQGGSCSSPASPPSPSSCLPSVFASSCP